MTATASIKIGNPPSFVPAPKKETSRRRDVVHAILAGDTPVTITQGYPAMSDIERDCRRGVAEQEQRNPNRPDLEWKVEKFTGRGNNLGEGVDYLAKSPFHLPKGSPARARAMERLLGTEITRLKDGGHPGLTVDERDAA